jgi:hypothetical protein
MKYRLVGIICQLAAVTVALLGSLPAALLLNPWRSAKKTSQLDEIYFSSNLLSSGLIALGAFAAAYILFRVGSHLKSKSKGDQPSTHGREDVL